MSRLFTCLAITLFLVLSVFRIVSEIQYDRNVGGLLKQAADANTISLAEERLGMAIAGLARDGICPNYQDKTAQCSTSILWGTPDEDVAYWRRNLSATLQGLQNMTPEARQDESKSGIQLVKVKETLLDSTKSGDSVTNPSGISIYGHNGAQAVLWTMFLLLISMGILTYRKQEW